MNEDVEEALISILDTMTGADGGVSFIYFKLYLESIGKEDTWEARELEKIVLNFARLIAVVQPK